MFCDGIPAFISEFICQTSPSSPHSMQICEYLNLSYKCIEMLVRLSEIAIEHLGPAKGSCPFSVPCVDISYSVVTN